MKKRILATCLLSILGITSLAAQSKMSEDQKMETKARYQAYKEQLNLSDEQASKVEAINRTYFEGLSGLKNSQGSRLAKLRKYKELSSTKDRQIEQVLTREQYAIYQQQQKVLKEEFRNNRSAQ